MEKHIYVAERKQGFNFVVEVDGKRERVRFVDGQFKTDNDKLAEAIDALREINPGIARRCRKADKAAAEKLAREHREMLKRTGAVKGGLTAEAARHSMDISLAERDLKLRNQNVDVEDFAKENLQMTEVVDNPSEKVDTPDVKKVAPKTKTVKSSTDLSLKTVTAK